MMKTIVYFSVFSVLIAYNLQAQMDSSETPVTAVYFYKVKWGYQDEFIHLYKKNHYPVMKAQVESGRLLKFEAYAPRFHGDGRQDWTFMTVLVFKNWRVMADDSEMKEIIKTLYPDHETFRREEQRRFEILEAHWDVPLRKILLD